MNIFVTNEHPKLAAESLDDKRVIKMVLESVQMLCTAMNYHGATQAPYKSTHVNHPSNIWARATRGNFMWLYWHATELMNQYEYAYDKMHKCTDYMDLIFEAARFIPDGGITPFANCAANSEKGVSYKHLTDVTEAYRRYLVDRWNGDMRKPTWKNRNMPFWAKVDKEGKFVYSG